MTLTAASGVDAVLERIDAELSHWHVPGLELAVVRRGDVVHAGGFGLADIESGRPVTAATLFHHGSCGKAFTALLAVLLAEDGVIDLDLPVRTYVPELRLPDPVIAERATIRDLLSHRTGLDRHDHAWIFNPSWSRDECVRRMEHLPLAADLRVKMQYSNFGYTLAGLAMERATGSSYEDQLTKRVLEAAGMTRATASFDRTIADPDHAEPYRLVDDVALRTEFRLMPATEPAGAVRSCADDTAKWLLVQLGHGPLPADVIRRTHDLHIATADLTVPWPEVRLYGYALGWAVSTYRGRPMLWHTGGIDGFFTYTLLLPEDDIGVAASVNVLEAPLSQAVVWDVVDALLGEGGERAWTDRLHPDTLNAEAAAAQGEQPTPAAPDPRPADPALPVHALDAYVGRFSNGGYGDLVVAVEDGSFAVRIGEYAHEAKHRGFDTWDLRYVALDSKATLSFFTDPDGVVSEAVVRFEDVAASVRYNRVKDETG